jgi:hypothetical protein
MVEKMVNTVTGCHFAQIDKVMNMAKKINAIVFIDVQVALSKLQDELRFTRKIFIDAECSFRN